MSKYYVIGCNKELKSNPQTFKHTTFNVDFLRDINQKCLNEKYFYIVDFDSMNDIGYNITNYHELYSNSNKQFFMKFLSEIDELLNLDYEISLYQFWEGTQNKDLNPNFIYQSKEISTNPEDYDEDFFQFEFNTKYVFVKNLTLTNP